MSRHTIHNNDIEVVVGYDPPLRTFFAQVFNTAAGSEGYRDVLGEPSDYEVLVWLPSCTIEEALGVTSDHAELTTEEIAVLRTRLERDVTSEPLQHQLHSRRW